MTFKFNLKQRVSIIASDEVGEVVGRADYPHLECAYCIRYKAGDGRAVEAWWTEQALKAAG